MAKSIRPSFLSFFRKPFFSDPRTIAVLWFIIAVVVFFTKHPFDPTKGNNFLIFRGVFYHTIHQLPLFASYPAEYADVNHYGPVFSLVIAPFALLPRVAGLFLWYIFLAATLFVAIRKMPLSEGDKSAISWIVTLELLHALQMQQFNIAIAAMVVGTYIAARDDRPSTAAFLIMLGTFTKIYGIVAIAFFPFIQRKGRFLLWALIWAIILFVAPMLISSPEYICSQYVDWFRCLTEKNMENGMAVNDLQNISAIGMIHRISGAQFSDVWILLPAMLLFALPLLRVKKWGNYSYQWGIVASALMCIILFSTGSESSGYVIAFLGVAIWYTQLPSLSLTSGDVSNPAGRYLGWKLGLLILAFLICGFGGSDIVPRSIKVGIVRAYSLKALPVLCIWLYLTMTLLISKFPSKNTTRRYCIRFR